MTSLSIRGKVTLLFLFSMLPKVADMILLRTVEEMIKGLLIMNHSTSSVQGGSVSDPIYMYQELDTESLSKILVMFTAVSIHFYVS